MRDPFLVCVCVFSNASRTLRRKAARTVFKNVGLQAAEEESCEAASPAGGSRSIVVAIWGDEGLEMPVRGRDGASLFAARTGETPDCDAEWLADVVNEKHERNWAKIRRFESAVGEARSRLETRRACRDAARDARGDDDDDDDLDTADASNSQRRVRRPRAFDVIGDVAMLRAPLDADDAEAQRVGLAILSMNGKLRVLSPFFLSGVFGFFRILGQKRNSES